MKRAIALLAVLLIAYCSTAQNQRLTALMSWSSFQTADGMPYLETYLSFDAWNMQFEKESDGKYRATADIVLQVTSGDTTVFIKKYELKSPAVGENDSRAFNFIDLQRFALANGTYTLRFSISDHNVKADPIEVTDKIWVNYDSRTPKLSSVLTLSSIEPTSSENMLSRNGYDMQPYIDEFFPEQMQALYSYFEIYNIQKELFSAEFMVVSFIETRETGRPIESIRQVQRFKGAPLIPVVSSLDISQLPSGNYNLVIEVRNRDNQLMLFNRTPFIRSNPNVQSEEIGEYAASFASTLNDENQLNYFLDALYPIASQSEKDWVSRMIVLPGHIAEKQAFFYNFWVSRNKLDPEKEWREYRALLDYVAANFSYPRTPGYKTDRGRVCLQYGKPDNIRDEKNFVAMRSSASNISPTQMGVEANMTSSQTGQIFYLPYQLWRYNALDGDEPNRVFLFWDEFRSGYYKLLNSNAKGEVQDPKWERTLSQQQLNENELGEVGIQFNRGY